MPSYAQLPIYNDILFVLKDLYERVPKFSKQYKYLLGERMLERPVEALKLIQKISGCRDRSKRIVYVKKIRSEMDELLVYVRIANELHQLGGKKSYIFVAKNVVDILNQTKNWKKHLQKQ